MTEMQKYMLDFSFTITSALVGGGLGILFAEIISTLAKTIKELLTKYKSKKSN